MADTPWWASVPFWKHVAIWTTAIMTVVLIILTFHTLKVTRAGGPRVPGYDVINYKIDYVYDEKKRRYVPVIGEKAPLFGKELTPEEAEALVTHGKKTVQGKNCMNCHTLLGNGAYFAPDLTKAWLDPAWGSPQVRENLMLSFLLDPPNNARTFGTGRKMPNLGLTEEEAKAVIAFLKWMSAIDTNGFPYHFKTIHHIGG
ncbi:MAG: cytochrome c [Gammaproteobacteria bacterium]|nr:MAG: cytochrome c [Gammaproteobacteria bacterium]